MTQVWAQDLETIGFKLEIIEREQAPFYDEYFTVNYEIQAYGLGVGLLDPATTIGAGSPYRLASNKANIQTQPFFAEYSTLVEQGIGSVDPKMRKPIYDRLQEIIADEVFVVMTAWWPIFAGVSKRVKGYNIPGDRRLMLRDMWIEEEA